MKLNLEVIKLLQWFLENLKARRNVYSHELVTLITIADKGSFLKARPRRQNL